MASRGGRNNVIAGVFVLLALAAGVVVTLVLAGVREGITSRNSYTIRFGLSDGAEGLDVGSVVKVGGRKAGKVNGLNFYRTPGSDVIAGVDVVVAIDKDVTLYKNARVYLQLPLLGSQSQINIPFAGDPALLKLKEGETGLVSPGALLDGRLAPPAFLAQAGYGEEQSDQLRLILKRGADIADRLAIIAEKTDKQLDTALPAVAQAMVDVRAMTADFRSATGKWLPMVESTLSNLNHASGGVGTGIEEARQIIAGVQGIVATASPRVESILRNIDELTVKANTRLYDRIEQTVGSGQKALDEFARVGMKFSALTDELTPELRLTMGNARLASDQLKLALIEVRRNPWRLLYQPGKKEFAEEVLFDSARSYAQAVSNLRAASASLEQVINAAKVNGTPADAAQLADIQTRIQKAFSDYRKAETKFLDRLINEGTEEAPKNP
jgi:ABC-type transporter Mla subunit MlaD